MAISKVEITTGNGVETLVDLTEDTVQPETLAEGETAHAANGALIVGTAKKVNIVQETGNSETDIMSQAAVTRALNTQSEEIENYETLTLGVNADDGLIYIYKNGSPMGVGVEAGSSGDIVGYIDSDNTIVLSGALAEGTYTVKYEMEDGSLIDIGELVNTDAPTFTNMIPLSTDSSGNLYVGTNGEAGYKTDYRLSGSSGAESAQTGTEVTGFIPVTKGDVIYLKNITDSGTHVIGLYDSSYAKIVTNSITTMFGGAISGEVVSDTIDGSINATDSVAFMRVCADEITDESIITVNEPIE